MNPQDINSFEELCTTMYNTTDTVKQQEAAKRVQGITSSPDFINKAQLIIENSKNTYTLYITISSITSLLTTFWNNYTLEQKKEMRNFILKFVEVYGEHLPSYVLSSASKFIGRVTKLLWSVDDTDRNIQTLFSEFMSHSNKHIVLGFTVMADIVHEMNTILPGEQRTNYRKVAISFRESALFDIFVLAFNTLNSVFVNSLVIEDNSLKQSVYQSSLELIKACYLYDFIGATSDDVSEEISTIHIPAKWDTFVTQSSNIELLFQIYQTANVETATLLLDIVLCQVSIRRSLFISSEQRINYVTTIMNGLVAIMETKTNLQYNSVYNLFCQICGRLKANFQLTELTKIPVYPQFIQLLTELTISTFHQWSEFSNCISYLLLFWTRMVCADRYIAVDTIAQQTENYLTTSIPVIFQSFIEGKLETVEELYEDQQSNPLNQNELLMSELQQLPSIARFEYKVNFTYLCKIYDELYSQYSETLRMINIITANDEQEYKKIQYNTHIVENKLAWLVYIISSIITGQTFQECQNEEHQEEFDGELCKRVFTLIKNMDLRLCQCKDQLKVDIRLEYSILTFLDNFKRVFITQQQNILATLYSDNTETLTPKKKIIAHMYQIIGQGDPSNILNIIINKLSTNLKCWPDDYNIINQSLLLLQNLVVTYTTSKLLLKVPALDFLLQHHNSEVYAFLNSQSSSHLRTLYYNILTHLVLYDSNPSRFELFLYPLAQNTKQLNALSEQELFQVQNVYKVVCLCRDMRGVVDASIQKPQYITIFNTFYPDLFDLCLKLLRNFWSNNNVNSVILKLLSYFSFNKNSRIDFGSSSPNNILLFRAASEAVNIFGNNVLEQYFQKNMYPEEIFKPLRYLFDIMTNALSGHYIPFGVFILYNDQCLNTALRVCFQLIVSLPYNVISQYPKACNALFSLLENLFMSHMDTIAQLSQYEFMILIDYLTQGIESFNADVVIKATSSIDHLATFIYLNKHKSEDATIKALYNHISQVPTFWTILYKTLFNSLLFGDKAIQWSLSRPLLSITILEPTVCAEYHSTLINSQPPEIQPRITQALQQLKPAENNLDATTRDSYSVATGIFRQEVLDFIIL